MMVWFLATAASRSMLSENATSMIRSTPAGAYDANGRGWIGLVERDGLEARIMYPREIGAGTHRPDDLRTAPVGELGSERSDTTKHTVHQHGHARDGSIPKDGPVGGDPWDTQASANLVTHGVGELDRLSGGNNRHLRRGSERAVRLSAVHPYPLADPPGVHTIADGVDHPCSVAVRDHPRERHLRPQPAAPLLRIPRVDPRPNEADTDLARGRLGRRELTDLEHLARASLPLVPGRKHDLLLPRRHPERDTLQARALARPAPHTERSDRTTTVRHGGCTERHVGGRYNNGTLAMVRNRAVGPLAPPARRYLTVGGQARSQRKERLGFRRGRQRSLCAPLKAVDRRHHRQQKPQPLGCPTQLEPVSGRSNNDHQGPGPHNSCNAVPSYMRRVAAHVHSMPDTESLSNQSAS